MTALPQDLPRLPATHPVGAPPRSPTRSPTRRVPRRPRRQRTWDPLLISVSFYILCGVGRFHQLFSPLEQIKPIVLATLVTFALYAVEHNPARRLATALRMPAIRWVLLFSFWSAVTVPFALHKGVAFYAWAATIPQMVGMCIMLVAAVRDWKDVERLAYVYFIAVAIYAAVVLVRFDISDESWRLGSLYYYDSNDFATLCVMALPIGLHFIVTPRHWIQRLITVAGCGCMLVAYIWSGSRGGFLALIAVSGFLLVSYKAIHAAWRIAATAVMMLVLVATASDAYWKKMQSLFHVQSDYNVSNPWGRVQVWERGIGYMIRFPAFGVGFNNFQVAEGTLFERAVYLQSHGKGAKWGVAHNSFVQAGAELGMPGLLLYVAIIGSVVLALRSVRAIPRGPRGPPQLAQSLTASMLAFLVGALFLTLTYSDLIFCMVALGVALAKVTRVRRVRPARGQPAAMRLPPNRR